jgi:hypothetical protein
MGRPLIGAKGFQSFHWTRGTSSRKVMKVTKRKGIVCMRGREKEEEKEVEEKLLVLMFLCAQESSMEGMCARIKHRKNVCKN